MVECVEGCAREVNSLDPQLLSRSSVMSAAASGLSNRPSGDRQAAQHNWEKNGTESCEDGCRG